MSGCSRRRRQRKAAKSIASADAYCRILPEPTTVVDRVPENGAVVGERNAGVGIGAEEVTIVRKVVGPDEQDEVGEPKG